jgi:hypothetical protein
MKGIERRRKIFEVYSANLQYFTGLYKIELGVDSKKVDLVDTPIYICPLCTRAYSIELIDHNFDNNHLTLEDLPPKSVGGNPKILTCKECNSKAGHSLDKAISESIKIEQFFKKIPSTKVTGIVGFNKGRKFKTIIEVGKEGQLKFDIITPDNPLLRKQLEHLRTHWDTSTMEFTVTFPQRAVYLASLIRVGLLLSFYYFGNRILFEGNYHRIREYVTDRENVKLPHDGIVFLSDKMPTKSGVHLLTYPEKNQVYLIIFSVKSEDTTRIVGVPIPGPGELGWTRYCNFNSLKSEEKVDFLDVTSTAYITNSDLMDAYNYLYKNLNKLDK